MSCRSRAETPAATSAPTMAPADVPATCSNEKPCSSRTSSAPTRPRPLTPPPSRTRSTLGTVSGDGPRAPRQVEVGAGHGQRGSTTDPASSVRPRPVPVNLAPVHPYCPRVVDRPPGREDTEPPGCTRPCRAPAAPVRLRVVGPRRGDGRAGLGRRFGRTAARSVPTRVARPARWSRPGQASWSGRSHETREGNAGTGPRRSEYAAQADPRRSAALRMRYELS